MRPRHRRLGHYLALTDGEDLRVQQSDARPPLYVTAWGLGPYLRLLDDPRLDLSMLGVVHAQNDLISHVPVRPDDWPSLRLSVERLHRDAQRVLITVRCDLRVQERTAAEIRSVLVSGISPAEASREATGQPPGPRGAGHTPDPQGWTTIRTVALARDHSLRYALFSGDVNPLHLHPRTSRPFGFDEPILHGFCLKSIMAHAVLRAHGQADPGLLRRLRIRFRTAVSLPATLRIQTRGARVRAVSGDGSLLYADGRYRLGPPAEPGNAPRGRAFAGFAPP
jgi:acyl dehydratase